jgi:hypothetical protein
MVYDATATAIDPSQTGGEQLPGLFCKQHRDSKVNAWITEKTRKEKAEMQAQAQSSTGVAAPRRDSFAAFAKHRPTEQPTEDADGELATTAPFDDNGGSGSDSESESGDFGAKLNAVTKEDVKLKEKTKRLKEENQYRAEKVKRAKFKAIEQEVSSSSASSSDAPDQYSESSGRVDPADLPINDPVHEPSIRYMMTFANKLVLVAEKMTPFVTQHTMGKAYSVDGWAQTFSSDADHQQALRDTIVEEMPEVTKKLSPLIRLSAALAMSFGEALVNNIEVQKQQATRLLEQKISSSTIVDMERKYSGL